MGRSAPTLRVAVRREIERLKGVAKAERDPKMRKALEEIIRVGERLLDAYSLDPPADAMEVVLLSALAVLFSRCLGEGEDRSSDSPNFS